jgi:hypothetical protein
LVFCNLVLFCCKKVFKVFSVAFYCRKVRMLRFCGLFLGCVEWESLRSIRRKTWLFARRQFDLNECFLNSFLQASSLFLAFLGKLTAQCLLFCFFFSIQFLALLNLCVLVFSFHNAHVYTLKQANKDAAILKNVPTCNRKLRRKLSAKRVEIPFLGEIVMSFR